MNQAIGLSLAFHMTVYFSFYFVRSSVDEAFPLKALDTPHLSFDLIDADSSSPLGSSELVSAQPPQFPHSPKSPGSSEVPSKSPGQTSSSLQLKSLVPEFSPSPNFPTASLAEGSRPEKTYDAFGEEGAFGLMRSMGPADHFTHNPFFSAIWKKINDSLLYPDDFVKHRITGQVSVHLTVNEQGVFVGDFLDISGDDNLLTAYVATGLTAILSDPLDSSVWLDSPSQIPIVLSFDFETYSLHGDRVKMLEHNFKNSLVFSRREYVEPVLNERLNEVFTHYLPITLINGEVYIDLIRAYMLIKNFGEPTERQLRERRLKNLREELQDSIQRSS